MKGSTFLVRFSTSLVLAIAAFETGRVTAPRPAPPARAVSGGPSQRAQKLMRSTDRVFRDRLGRMGGKPANPAGRDAMLKQIVEWASVDPVSALNYIRAHFGLDERNAAVSKVLAAWAASDPESAWNWTVANLPNDYMHYDAVLSEIGKAHPETAWRFATDLAALKPEFAQTIYVGALRGMLYEGNYDVAARFALTTRLPAGQHQFDLTSLVAGEWGLYDPEKAAAWVLSIPEDGTIARQQALVSLGISWAESDPEAAATFAMQLPSGVARQDMLSTALQSWAERNPENVGTWLIRYKQDPDLDLVVQAVATSHRLVDHNVNLALGWADTILNKSVRIQSLEQIVGRWLENDRAGATRYLQTNKDLSQATLDQVRAFYRIPRSP